MCLTPNIVRSRLDSETGAVVTTFLGKAGIVDPHYFGEPFVDHEWYTTVPCGKCRECKMDYAKQWANRMVLEAQDWPRNLFFTATYNNDNLPFNVSSGLPTLNKRDVQLFMKRLRKEFEPRKIRFYFAGEYGSRTHRPHYHAILFNLGLEDFPDRRIHSYNELKQSLYYSPKLEKLWGHGFILMSDVTWKTCNYVARYVDKKAAREEVPMTDGEFDWEPEFSLSSRRPGIGMRKAEELLSSGCYSFPVTDGAETFEFSLPSSILKRFRELGFDKSLEMSYNKAKVSRAKLISELDQTGLRYNELLERREKALTRKLNMLPERL